MKHYCTEKCFYRDRLWKEGEELNSVEGEKVPKEYFTTEKKEKAQSQKEAQAKALEAVGHGKKIAAPDEPELKPAGNSKK